jgi:hypothetical protein
MYSEICDSLMAKAPTSGFSSVGRRVVRIGVLLEYHLPRPLGYPLDVSLKSGHPPELFWLVYSGTQVLLAAEI